MMQPGKTRSIVLRFRAANRAIYNAIRSGSKSVETRAATERYRRIREGDTLVFSCGHLRFTRKVMRVRHFHSIGAMLNKYNVKDINPFVSSERELRAEYRSYPRYAEKLRRYGIMVIELSG